MKITSFDLQDAEDHGLEESVILAYFKYLSELYKKNKGYTQNGQTWLPVPVADIKFACPYLSNVKIKKAMGKLLRRKLLKQKRVNCVTSRFAYMVVKQS